MCRQIAAAGRGDGQTPAGEGMSHRAAAKQGRQAWAGEHWRRLQLRAVPAPLPSAANPTAQWCQSAQTPPKPLGCSQQNATITSLNPAPVDGGG